MTDKQALLALADRCEQATGADRELDVAIAVAACGFFVAEPRWEGGPTGYGYVDAEGSRVEPGHGGMQLVRKFTRSLDAAMTLIDAECFWRLGHDGEGPDPSLFEARVFDPMQMDRPALATAATPTLAITAACLRAIAGAME